MKSFKAAFLCVLFAVLTGCQSREIIYYTSPKVTGRVLTADTHQPLAGVTVERAGSQAFGSAWAFGPPKGGEVLIQRAGVRTDADGKFELSSKSVIAVLNQPGWVTVPLVFSHAGYETFQTNYSGTNVTSQAAADDGVPLLDVGEVLLQPVDR